MKYKILTSKGYKPFVFDSQNIEEMAKDILNNVETLKSNYVKVDFVMTKSFRYNLISYFEHLLNVRGCHLGDLVKLECDKDCEGFEEYAEYIIKDSAGRICSLTLEFKLKI